MEPDSTSRLLRFDGVQFVREFDVALVVEHCDIDGLARDIDSVLFAGAGFVMFAGSRGRSFFQEWRWRVAGCLHVGNKHDVHGGPVRVGSSLRASAARGRTGQGAANVREAAFERAEGERHPDREAGGRNPERSAGANSRRDLRIAMPKSASYIYI